MTNRTNRTNRNSLALLLLLPCLFGSCVLPTLDGRVMVGYMNITPRGDLGLEDSAGSQAVGNIKIDVEDELNLEDAGTLYLRGEVDLGNFRFIASGFRYEDSGASVLTTPFGDIPASSSVNSELTITNLKGAVTYRLPVPIVDLSVGVCLDYFDLQMDVAATDPVVAFEALDIRVPVPMLYARASTEVGMFSAGVDAGWLSVDLGDGKGNFFDLDAMVGVQPVPYVEIFAGYRYVLIDALGDFERQNYDTELMFSGWYLGGGITF